MFVEKAMLVVTEIYLYFTDDEKPVHPSEGNFENNYIYAYWCSYDFKTIHEAQTHKGN